MDLHLPKFIGHRGAAAAAPENTLAGLRKARELGCTWVEFDARISADRHPVLMHDATVDRTTNGTGLVSNHTVAQLHDLDAGSWFDGAFAGAEVPALESALDECARLGLGVDIELKTDRQGPGRESRIAVEAVARAIAAAWRGANRPLLVSSFDVELLDWSRRLLPDVPRMICSRTLGDDIVRTARQYGCAAIACDARRLHRTDPAKARQAGYPLTAYTVNDNKWAKELFGWGVRAVFTDRPDRIAAIG